MKIVGNWNNRKRVSLPWILFQSFYPCDRVLKRLPFNLKLRIDLTAGHRGRDIVVSIGTNRTFKVNFTPLENFLLKC